MGFYPFQSQLSITSNPDKILWGDLRIETNTFFTNMNMELSPMFNIRRKEAVNYYTGGGVVVNPAYVGTQYGMLNGYFISFGARVKPVAAHRAFHVMFEISPYVNSKLGSGNLRARLGFAYFFTRKAGGSEQ